MVAYARRLITPAAALLIGAGHLVLNVLLVAVGP